MNKNKIVELTQRAAAMLPVLQLAPNERNCIQLASVYGILREIEQLAQEEERKEANTDG